MIRCDKNLIFVDDLMPPKAIMPPEATLPPEAIVPPEAIGPDTMAKLREAIGPDTMAKLREQYSTPENCIHISIGPFKPEDMFSEKN